MGIIGLGHIEPVRGVAAHPYTYSFPTLQRQLQDEDLVPLALSSDPALYPAVAEAATSLVEEGVTSVLTTCGYFAPYQTALADLLPVPVLTSSLLQLPTILTMIGRKRVLVLAANAEGIDIRCLTAVGVGEPERLLVVGLEGVGPFRDQVLCAGGISDVGAIVHQTLDLVQQALNAHKDVGAICLECGDLCLASAALRHVTGLPVFDYVTAAEWLYAISRRVPAASVPNL